jgi:hypothetical protein
MQQPELTKEKLLPSEYIKMLAEDIRRKKRVPLTRFDLFQMSDMINSIIIYLDAEFKLNDIKASKKFQNVSGDVPSPAGK